MPIRAAVVDGGPSGRPHFLKTGTESAITPSDRIYWLYKAGDVAGPPLRVNEGSSARFVLNSQYDLLVAPDQAGNC
jgi:hypothetical protein